MTLDLKDHFLASPIPSPAYMKIPLRYIPADIMEIKKNYIYCKFKKSMYGLKQAALLA